MIDHGTPELSEYGEKFMREELMRRTRSFPKGWTLKTIEPSNHGFGYRCVLDGGNRTQWAYGETPDGSIGRSNQSSRKRNMTKPTQTTERGMNPEADAEKDVAPIIKKFRDGLEAKTTQTTPEQIAKELAQALENCIYAHDFCLEHKGSGANLSMDLSLITGAANAAKEAIQRYRGYRDETGNF